MELNPYVRTYMNFYSKKGYWTDNVHNLELLLNKMKEKGPKFNIKKTFFEQTEMEYLGFWVTRDGVKPINRKIKVITNMKPPASRK